MLIEDLDCLCEDVHGRPADILAVHVEYHSLVWTPVIVHVDCQVVNHDVEQVDHDIVCSVLGVQGRLRLANMQSMLWHTLETNGEE